MIATGYGKEFCVCLGGAMTTPASVIQADLTGGKRAIVIELADQARIDRDHMRVHVAHEAVGVGRSALNQAWHVTISTTNPVGNMGWIILKLSFPEMAILALQACGWLARLF